MVTIWQFLVLAVVCNSVFGSGESSKEPAKNDTQSSRGARTDYTIYSPPDESYLSKPSVYYKQDGAYKDGGDAVTSFESESNPRGSKDAPTQSALSFEEYVPAEYYRPPVAPRPPRYYSSPKGGITKSGSSVNWNVWKGDQVDDLQPDTDDFKGPPSDGGSFYFPTAWKGDSWTPDQMGAMMTMMNHMQSSSKPKFGILSKIVQEPIAILIAALLPVSLILAAVLPTLVNMMMNGGIPTLTTTATGNNGRNLDGADFLIPVIEAIANFGAKSFDNPTCMQRIFCQVTKGPSNNGTQTRPLQKALYRASTLVDGYWLNTFGVKALFDSMGDGNCDSIPCSSFTPTPRDGKPDTYKTA